MRKPALTTQLRTELALEALEMAIRNRDERLDGLIHHSDFRRQYVAHRCADALASIDTVARCRGSAQGRWGAGSSAARPVTALSSINGR
jgi:transposase InsO family protein